jgi:hypothetical protein
LLHLWLARLSLTLTDVFCVDLGACGFFITQRRRRGRMHSRLQLLFG